MKYLRHLRKYAKRPLTAHQALIAERHRKARLERQFSDTHGFSGKMGKGVFNYE